MKRLRPSPGTSRPPPLSPPMSYLKVIPGVSSYPCPSATLCRNETFRTVPDVSEVKLAGVEVAEYSAEVYA